MLITLFPYLDVNNNLNLDPIYDVIGKEVDYLEVGDLGYGGVVAGKNLVAVTSDAPGVYNQTMFYAYITALNYSSYGGYNDWREPEYTELQTLYNNRGLIGGFIAAEYWSNTLCPSGYPYYYDWSFITGSGGCVDQSTTLHARAVRTQNGVG